MKNRMFAGWAVTGLVAWVLVPGVGRATDQQVGRVLYEKYCSACHGVTGKGDGGVAPLMDPKPSDLTLLAKKAGGQFPFYGVVKMIDGRTVVRGHGDPDMPVWGELFVYWQGTDPDRQAVSAGKVALITEYLASIQGK